MESQRLNIFGGGNKKGTQSYEDNVENLELLESREKRIPKETAGLQHVLLQRSSKRGMF